MNLEHTAGIHLAHHGKLLEVVGLAIHVGAHIEQHAWIALGGRHGSGQRRTVDAGHCAEHHFGGGHGRAGVAGGYKAGGLALAHQLEADAHGAVLLGADGVRRLLIHANAFGGMVDDDGQVFVFEVLVEQVAELGLRPDQVDAHGQSCGRRGWPPGSPARELCRNLRRQARCL
jgi:hypothetical protein